MLSPVIRGRNSPEYCSLVRFSAEKHGQLGGKLTKELGRSKLLIARIMLVFTSDELILQRFNVLKITLRGLALDKDYLPC